MVLVSQLIRIHQIDHSFFTRPSQQIVIPVSKPHRAAGAHIEVVLRDLSPVDGGVVINEFELTERGGYYAAGKFVARGIEVAVSREGVSAAILPNCRSASA